MAHLKLDDMEPHTPSNFVKEYSQEWAKNILQNSAMNKVKIAIDKARINILKLSFIDPGMIVQKILIDSGGFKNHT